MASTIVKCKDVNSPNGHLNSVNGSKKVFLAVQKSPEFSETVKFLNTIDKGRHLNLLYVTLVSSYIHIENVLLSKPLTSKNIFIADCVSKLLVNDLKDSFNVIFRNSPNNFEEMKKIMLDGISFSKHQIVVLDSLSQFLNYSNMQDSDIRKLFSFLKESFSDGKFGNIDKIILLFNEKLSSFKSNNDLKKICRDMNIDYLDISLPTDF